MRTQRASSPQMLALVAQLVSLGSVGDREWVPSLSRPRPALALWPPAPHAPPPPLSPLTDAAVLLVGAVPTVVEHVAAQRGGEAALVLAQKLLLVFAVGGLGRGGLCGKRGLQALGIRHPGSQATAGEGGTQASPFVKLSGEAG